MEITTTAINLEFLPTESNGGRGVRNLEFVLQHMHEMLTIRTSQEANDIVANSRKNPLEAWRRLHERYDPTAGGRKRNSFRAIISPGRCALLELQVGIARWVSKVVRYEKLKGKLDDEIKRAGPESLVLEELEKHLMLNSIRLETFEDVCLQVVKCVEEKFGFRIRDFKPEERLGPQRGRLPPGNPGHGGCIIGQVYARRRLRGDRDSEAGGSSD